MPRFNTDLESAVDCFRPILKRLRIRQEAAGVPVFLSSFPHLWNLNEDTVWVITILKTNLYGSKAKFVSQFSKDPKIMQCYIILDNGCYMEAKVPHEIRKAVVVHEFCHFLALIYSTLSTSEENLKRRLEERLSKTVDELTNEQVLKLYQLLNQVRPNSDAFSTFEQTKDEHFRLNCENLDLSYTDLFKSFLLSRQMFDEYFLTDDKNEFSKLLKEGRAQEALNLYTNIAKRIAQDKWLPVSFAISQSVDMLMKFYLKKLL